EQRYRAAGVSLAQQQLARAAVGLGVVGLHLQRPAAGRERLVVPPRPLQERGDPDLGLDVVGVTRERPAVPLQRLVRPVALQHGAGEEMKLRAARGAVLPPPEDVEQVGADLALVVARNLAELLD